MTAKNRNRMEEYFDRLWPLPRSISGPGFTQSLDILTEMIPFKRLKYATHKKVFDWHVPQEWHPHDAYIIGPDGK